MRVRRDRDNVTLVDDERLVVPYLAEALGGTHDEAREALSNLCDILPPMRDRVGVVGVPTLAALCGDLGALARRLAKLRALFPDPRCDVAAMVCASPHLLHEDVDGVIAPSLRALRDLFPDAGVDGAPEVLRERAQTESAVAGLPDEAAVHGEARVCARLPKQERAVVAAKRCQCSGMLSQNRYPIGVMVAVVRYSRAATRGASAWDLYSSRVHVLQNHASLWGRHIYKA